MKTGEIAKRSVLSKGGIRHYEARLAEQPGKPCVDARLKGLGLWVE